MEMLKILLFLVFSLTLETNGQSLTSVCLYSVDLDNILSEIGIYGKYDIEPNTKSSQFYNEGRCKIVSSDSGWNIVPMYDASHSYARCNESNLLNCNNSFEIASNIDGATKWVLHGNIAIINCSNHWTLSDDNKDASTVHRFSNEYCTNYIDNNLASKAENSKRIQNGFCVSGTNTDFDGFYEFEQCRNWIPVYHKLIYGNNYYLLYDSGMSTMKIVKDNGIKSKNITNTRHFDATNMTYFYQILENFKENETNLQLQFENGLNDANYLETFFCLRKEWKSGLVNDYYKTENCQSWFHIDPITHHVSFYFDIKVTNCSFATSIWANWPRIISIDNGKGTKNNQNVGISKMVINDLKNMNFYVSIMVIGTAVLTCIIMLIIFAYRLGVQSTEARYHLATMTEMKSFMKNANLTDGESETDDCSQSDTDSTDSKEHSEDRL